VLPGASVPDGSHHTLQLTAAAAGYWPRTSHTGYQRHREFCLRKIIKTRGALPSDEAATKLLYLALRNLGVHWKPAIEWRAAYAQFTVFFAERLPTTIR
jgi:putative transposase